MDTKILICQFRSGPLEQQERVAFLSRLHATSDEVIFCNILTSTDLPNHSELRGIILGGSGDNSLTRTDYSWYPMLRAYILTAIERKIPTLGICFGHQFLATLIGGRVVNDPSQKEIGVADVTMTDVGIHDELFSELTRTFSTMTGHNDSVVELPRESTILASNERCEVEAFRFGNKEVWGVQFHPELTPADYKERLDYYRDHYVGHGVDIEALYRLGERPTNDERILRNFNHITGVGGGVTVG